VLAPEAMDLRTLVCRARVSSVSLYNVARTLRNSHFYSQPNYK